MSLINQMLQDLDARQAASDGGRPLPSAVRPLPARRRARRPLVVGLVALLALGCGAAYYRLASEPTGAPAAAPVAIAADAAAPSAAPVEPALATEPAGPAAALPPPVVAATAPVPAPLEAAKAEGAVDTPAMARGTEAPRERPAPPARASVARPTVPPPGADKPASASTVQVAAPAGEPPRPTAAAGPPPLSSRPAKGASIERSDGAAATGDRADADYRQAINALNQGRSEEALVALRSALRGDALHRPARQLLVKLLIEAGRREEAMAALQEGLQGQPAQLGWAMTLARLQVDHGDLDAAWKTLDGSLPAAGQSADYQGFAAHLLQRLGRQREAIARFQAAARLAPGDGRWWLGLGLAHEAEGNTNEARDAFAHARLCANLGAELQTLVEQKLR